jgi:hypothetical protein
VTEEHLRELALALRAELAGVVDDAEEQRRLAAELDQALELPAGQAKPTLMATLRTRRETREWIAIRTGTGTDDVVRALAGQLGTPIAPVGVHVICPHRNYDRYLDSPNEDPGRCPYDGAKLVRADD